MLHFTCDCCKRPINTKQNLRYTVRLEVYASLDATEDDLDDERDHLQEIQDILERLDDSEDDQLGEDIYQQQRFDLCSDCRKRFMQNPLGWTNPAQLNFSQN